MSRPTPGAGGAYIFDHDTDSFVVVESITDSLAGDNPYQTPAQEPAAQVEQGPVVQDEGDI